MQNVEIGDLSVADLDAEAATIADIGLQTTAAAIEALSKRQYQPAVEFLRSFAELMFSIAVARAQADGLTLQRTPEESETALNEAAPRFFARGG